MRQVLFTLTEVKSKIEQGQVLLLAGDEESLRQLPAGNWIGGTIPYFMGETGGISSREKIYVTEIPDYVASLEIKVYDEKNIQNIYKDIPENGFGVVILPALSGIHLGFALNAPAYEEFAIKPLIGWISGVHLTDLGKETPKVFDGKHLRAMEDQAVALQVKLESGKIADIGILNIFEQGAGDTITFAKDGFSTTDAYINGEKCNFADYISANNFSTKLPLVADYYGVPVNISFQSVDIEKHEVVFYAPVFSGIRYRLAKPINDYVTEFVSRIPTNTADIVFSCNCILNYLYSELEGKKTGEITGPITFGEVAYQLLNQTMVYLTVSDLTD
jgi:hypothetical protein